MACGSQPFNAGILDPSHIPSHRDSTRRSIPTDNTSCRQSRSCRRTSRWPETAGSRSTRTGTSAQSDSADPRGSDWSPHPGTPHTARPLGAPTPQSSSAQPHKRTPMHNHRAQPALPEGQSPSSSSSMPAYSSATDRRSAGSSSTTSPELTSMRSKRCPARVKTVTSRRRWEMSNTARKLGNNW